MSVADLPQFPYVDAKLRAGVHVTLEDIGNHGFLCQNINEMRKFYERYDCRLVEHADSFYYLVNFGEIIPATKLSKKCVQVGKVIAYLARQPDILRSLGVIKFESVIQTLQTLMTKESLKEVFAPLNKEDSVQHKIVSEVVTAINSLASYNFLVKVKSTSLFRPTSAIARFTEMALYENNPTQSTRERLEEKGMAFDDSEEGEQDGN